MIHTISKITGKEQKFVEGDPVAVEFSDCYIEIGSTSDSVNEAVGGVSIRIALEGRTFYFNQEEIVKAIEYAKR